jgi:hypothetical protein
MGDAEDFETDMQTIRDYVHAVIEGQTKIAVAYTNALANTETTFRTASATEAKPNILGAVLKSGIKSLEKAAVSAIKSETGADLGPVVEMMQAVWDEVDRAEKAGQSLSAGEWIKNLRTKITNAYTQGRSGDELREQIENEYKQGDAGERGGYIGGIQNELAAMRIIKVPPTERLELAMYEEWINQYFDNDCMDGSGTVVLLFKDDGAPDSAKVNALLGDKVAGALNSVMSAAGIGRLMDLGVVKKVCKGDTCMCFEADNTVRKATNDDDVGQFLSSSDTWRQFTQFTV